MSRYRDVALFFALALRWGGSFVAIEVGLDYRFDLATLALDGRSEARRARAKLSLAAGDATACSL